MLDSIPVGQCLNLDGLTTRSEFVPHHVRRVRYVSGPGDSEMIPMDDAERTLRVLESLYCMRLHPAIDDFGAGYSSLSALRQFPISTLKIDKSFVRAVAVDRDDAMIAAVRLAIAFTAAHL